jgi:putative transposase
MAVDMAALCGWFGITRQAHYQALRRERKRRSEQAQVLALVQQVRRRHPRMGTRKLQYKLAAEIQTAGIRLGRDRLFALLRQADLLVKRPRRKRTTMPGLWRARNLLQEVAVRRPNQAWVSDITYVETEAGYCYLFLVSDLFSRRIMGWTVSSSLSAEGALQALRMAFRHAGRLPQGLIHHSDRGIQYTCLAYIQALLAVDARSSMGQTGNCYENAFAERINGILKLEYALGTCFLDISHVRRTLREAVALYNTDRPHLALNFLTPMAVYNNHAASLDCQLTTPVYSIDSYSTVTH